jgi:UDP-perosamine 4-acetyltransferase
VSVESILTPRVNANDAEAVMLRWLLEPLDAVSPGQPVCEIETTKANVEVAAEAKGYLFPLVSPGERVRVGQPLALLLPAPDPALASAASVPSSPPASGSTTSTSGGAAPALISESARELMEQHGLSDADFAGRSVVRRADIEEMLAARTRATAPHALDTVEGGENTVVLYGAGRHGLVVLDTIRARGELRPVAFIDDRAKDSIQGIPVFPASRLPELAARGVRFGHVSMGDTAGVTAAVSRMERAGLALVPVIHPSAVVSPLARLGRGVFVGPLVIIGPDAEIGDLCFLNNGASVAHHSVLSTHVILGDGARLGGNVRVGHRTLLGINVTVNKDVAIGDDVTVVSGVAVFSDVPAGMVVRADGKPHKRVNS